MTMSEKRAWVQQVLKKHEKVLLRELIDAYAEMFSVRLYTAKEAIHEMVKLELIETDTKYVFLSKERKENPIIDFEII